MILTKKYKLYGSTIHVLELESIPLPEDNEDLFNVGSYPIVVWNNEIELHPENIQKVENPWKPGSRGAIGVIGTKTVLVDVESNKNSRGMTLKELAQFMLHVLGCKTASVTPFEPIVAHLAYVDEEKAEEVIPPVAQEPDEAPQELVKEDKLREKSNQQANKKKKSTKK